MVHFSATETTPVPNLHINCADLVEHSPHIDKQRTAYLDPLTGTGITFSDLFKLSTGFAKALPRKFPDVFSPEATAAEPAVVTIFSPNVLLYPVLVLGILKSNKYLPEGSQQTVIVSTANAVLTSYECAGQWEANKASILIAHPSVLNVALEAWVHQLKRDPSRILLLDDDGLLTGSAPSNDTSSAHLKVGQLIRDGLIEANGTIANGHGHGHLNGRPSPLAPSSPTSPITPFSDKPHVPAFILFSSGTTSGKSKPIVISHYNVVGVILSMTAAETKQPNPAVEPGKDVVLGVAPLFHAYGMFNVGFLSQYLGLEVVLFTKFDAGKVVEVIDEKKINIGFVVPPMLLGMTKFASQRPPSTYPSLRWLMSAAAPLLEEVIVKTRNMFGREVLRNGFGMTELVATAIATAPGEPLSEGLAGVLNPNNEAKVIDPQTGMDSGFNEPGELYLRGPQVVREFFDSGRMLDRDGWLHTGDVATVDEKGVFVIRDRIKEMIKVNGISVAPADIETVLIAHPYVADAAVTSIPHPSAGEAPRAFVVIDTQKTAQLASQFGDDKTKLEQAVSESLKEWTRERMARYKQPDGGIVFVSEIPKSASGKVLRRLLKNL